MSRRGQGLEWRIMFERYDDHARHAIFFARYEASQSGSIEIGALHMLLGILRESGSIFIMAAAGFSVNDLMEECKRALPVGEKLSTSVDMPLSEDCRRALDHATVQADAMKSRRICPIHLALGLMSASGEVSAILAPKGISAAKLLKGVEVVTETASDTRSASGLLEFVSQDELVATSPLNLVNPLPRTGDEIYLTRGKHAETYKVLRVQHHFEGPPVTRTMAHCWLVKVVIEVEAIGGPLEMHDYT